VSARRRPTGNHLARDFIASSSFDAHALFPARIAMFFPTRTNPQLLKTTAMTEDQDFPSDAIARRHALERRRLLRGAAALPLLSMSGLSFAQAYPTAKVNTTKLAVTDTEVVIGQLHSATGPLAIAETGPIEAEQLAVDQINALGGVLGRKVRVILEDGASDPAIFTEKAQKLVINDRVATVIGCLTSAARKAVLPIFERENSLLYYPTFYEGLEQSKNVLYLGQEATQHVLFALDWANQVKKAKTYFFVGSDYNWPRISMKIARKHVEAVTKGSVKGEEYYPLDQSNFSSLINKIKLARPDCIFSALVGGSNVAFFKQLKAAGVTADKQFLMTISVAEEDLVGIGGDNFAGFYGSMKYFQSLPNENNQKFVAAFKAKYGQAAVVGDVSQSGYLAPWFWKAAVEKAGSFDVDKVIAASAGLEFKNAPEGPVKLDANHHLWSRALIGKGQPDGSFKVVGESPNLIRPEPFPKGYQ
jgi:urea transport system substrate-binding protein